MVIPIHIPSPALARSHVLGCRTREELVAAIDLPEVGQPKSVHQIGSWAVIGNPQETTGI